MMSTYVMSDIHGNSDAFFRMLKKINLSDNDLLYILGDAIDRNPGSVEMLKYIKEQDNIIMLLGNHEYMMSEYYRGNDCFGSWDCNGGDETRALLENLEENERDELIEWVDVLPLRLSITVNNTDYVLCHAYPFSDDKETAVWTRIMPYESIEDNIDRKYIIGHTPTLNFGYNSCGAEMIKNINGNLYYIDCGAGYTDFFGARLCCLRLEDEKEFYVDAYIDSKEICA